MRREIFRLPFLCRHCVHTMEPGKVSCVQGLELPAYGGFCAGFTLARKTDGNERPQKALPSCEACRIMRAPKNNARRHKSLSDFPRAGKILVILHLLSTPARTLARRVHILGRLQRPGSREAPAVSHWPGSVVACPFYFPKQCEVQNV